MSVLVSHSGKQHAYQHALSLQKLGLLDRFVTSSYYRRDQWPDRVLTWSGRTDRGMSRRYLSGLDSRRVSRRWDLELPEIWHRNVRRDGKAAEAAMFRRDANFDTWVARRFAAGSKTFWGFQGSCLDSLKAARSAGRLAICEFATAHVTAAIRILSDEAEKHPEWADTISNLHFPDWYRNRLEEEPLAADLCIAASGFTKQSLMEAGVDESHIDLLPLAADLEQFQTRARDKEGPLKVLFVGGIGQRKGMKYLLEAMSQLQSANVQLSLLGPLPADETPLHSFKHLFEYLGRTDQAGVAKEMLNHDVLVLPSVFEGFGLVIIEAMATGMPVIASTHSCGPEVIREGRDGFVLAPDDVAGLADKLDWCAANRSQVVEMGMEASKRSQEYSWRCHRDRLRNVLERIEQSGRCDFGLTIAATPDMVS